jgi:hypothetical protein
MGLMVQLIQSRRGTLGLSTVVGVTTAIAILGFGAPPVVMAPVFWGSTAAYAALYSWSSRKIGRW